MRLVLTVVAYAAITALSASARAGDVTVAVTNGSLVLTGTASSDDVVVDQSGLATPDQFRVTPGVGTTVNGSGSAATFSAVTKDIIFRLDAGVNSASIEESKLPRDVRVEAGAAGSTQLQISKSTVKDDVLASTGGGAILVTIESGIVRDDVEFAGGPAADRFAVSGRALVFGSIAFDGAAGDDRIEVENSNFAGDVDCEGGADDDLFSFETLVCEADVSIHDDLGDDALELDRSEVDGSLKVELGTSGDVASMSRSFCGGSTLIALGDGNNLIEMEESHFAGAFKTTAGDGADGIAVSGTCSFDRNVSIAVGDGTNSVTLIGLVVGGNVKCVGGSGVDEFAFGDGRGLRSAKFVLGTTPPMASDRVTVNDATIDGSVKVISAGRSDCDFLSTHLRGGVKAILGPGDNEFSAVGSTVTDFRVNSGDGNDLIAFQSGSVANGDVVISGANGNNIVNVLNSAIKRDLEVSTGSGNDTISSVGTIVGGTKTVDPGAGADTVFQ